MYERRLKTVILLLWSSFRGRRELEGVKRTRRMLFELAVVLCDSLDGSQARPEARTSVEASSRLVQQGAALRSTSCSGLSCTRLRVDRHLKALQLNNPQASNRSKANQRLAPPFSKRTAISNLKRYGLRTPPVPLAFPRRDTGLLDDLGLDSFLRCALAVRLGDSGSFRRRASDGSERAVGGGRVGRGCHGGGGGGESGSRGRLDDGLGFGLVVLVHVGGRLLKDGDTDDLRCTKREESASANDEASERLKHLGRRSALEERSPARRRLALALREVGHIRRLLLDLLLLNLLPLGGDRLARLLDLLLLLLLTARGLETLCVEISDGVVFEHLGVARRSTR